MSHELKRLSLLLGFTETLIDGAKEDPEVLINFAHHAKDAQRLQQLIQEILELLGAVQQFLMQNKKLL